MCENLTAKTTESRKNTELVLSKGSVKCEGQDFWRESWELLILSEWKRKRFLFVFSMVSSLSEREKSEMTE